MMGFNANDVGNYFSCFFNNNQITYSNILTLDLICIVQAGVRYRGACNDDRIQVSDGGDRTCLADLEPDV